MAVDHPVRVLGAAEARAVLPDLAAILADSVAAGASVSFMNPFSRDDAAAWWRGVIAAVEAGTITLLGATVDGTVKGTVQLIPSDKPNQPHRGDIAKMLVHPSARNRGVGAALMRAVEAEAARQGLTLLVLDTATGSSGERLYARMGWSRVGVIPDYALWPDGGFCDTTVFYKRIEALAARAGERASR